MAEITSEVPVVFAAPRRLRTLNVIAVGGSLAALTAAFLMGLGHLGLNWGVLAGAPTFFVGTLWAILLRWDKRVKALGFRWGWIASLPLAALNGGIATGLTMAVDMGGDASAMLTSFMIYGVVGATFGIVVWAPALIAVLVVFGLPIAHSQRVAQRGLAGEERGERVIAILASALGAFALIVALVMRTFALTVETGPLLQNVGRFAFFSFAALAIGCGGGAATWATLRENRRRDFVRRVEAGGEPGFRVESTAAGKVLLRVASAGTYRTTERSEAVSVVD